MSDKAERQKRIAALEKGRVPPQELFRPPNVPEGTYGSWDAEGLPLTDGEGKELSKSAGKKVKKEWELQEKRHKDFLEWQKEQDFPICPTPDEPGTCNVYQDLQLPDRIYDHINDYYEEQSTSDNK